MDKHYGFLEILKGSMKIFSKNGKLLTFTAIFYLVLYSISFILNNFFTKPYLFDLILKLFSLASTRPGTPEYANLLSAIRKDIGVFLGIETAFIYLSFFIGLFAKTTITFISSYSYTGRNLSLNELVLNVSKSWIRPFITLFYVQLLALGYTSFFLLPFLIPSLVLFDHPTLLIMVLVFIALLFFTFSLYLSIVWELAVVVSVIEDSFGISALEKARDLVKGKRVHGFLLNLFVNVVLGIVFMIGYKLSHSMPIMVGVVQVVVISLLNMFMSMGYTVLYYECQKNLKISSGSLEYSKIPAAPVLDEDLP